MTKEIKIGRMTKEISIVRFTIARNLWDLGWFDKLYIWIFLSSTADMTAAPLEMLTP